MCHDIDRIFLKTSDVNHLIQKDRYYLWMQCIHCVKGLKMYPMDGRVYNYDVSWAKVFRLTVVFAVTKFVMYYATLDFASKY